MLQEIEPHIFDNNYCKGHVANCEDKILCFGKNEIYMREDAESASGYAFPFYKDIFADGEEITAKETLKSKESYTENGEEGEILHYLFSIDDVQYFLIDKEILNCTKNAEPKYKFYSIQVFRNMGEGDTVPLAMMTGLHIYTWMKKNRYCGNCGNKTEKHGKERALYCRNCGNIIFPQIAPVVAIAVTDGNKLLLARNAQGGSGRFSILAGFVEIGESLEQAVKREVKEEVGVSVKNLRYYNSQPWGLTGIEMMGFFADLDGENDITIQESELAEAHWFAPEEIDWEMPLHSLSFTMISEFRRRCFD